MRTWLSGVLGPILVFGLAAGALAAEKTYTNDKFTLKARLTNSLRAGGDVKSQLKSLLDTTKQELVAMVPGSEVALPAKLSAVRNVSGKIDWLLEPGLFG